MSDKKYVSPSRLKTFLDNLKNLFATKTEMDTALGSKADKSQAIFYIEGTSTTAGVWTGSHSDISEYYNGLVIAYKVNIAGISDGSTLNINGLGAISVMRNATSAVTTHFGVDSVIILVYTEDSGTAYWKLADYDSDKKVAQYSTVTDSNYPLLFKYSKGNTSTSTSTTYVRFNNSMYVNPSTGTITAKEFSGGLTGDVVGNLLGNVTGNVTGDLTGNADTATKAAQDANGNVIVDTYETKTNADARVVEINASIAQKANSSHSHDASDITDLETVLDTKVNTSITINEKPLSADIVLAASDVGADVEGSAETALNSAKTYTDEIAKTKSDVGHTHDDLYYTESEIDTKITTISQTYETKADASTKLDEAKSHTEQYTDTRLQSYYTITQINNMEFITTDDIDEICGASVSAIEEATY